MIQIDTVTLCGIDIPVFEATEEEVPELANDVGCFKHAKCQIFVRHHDNPSALRDTVAHEAVHAFIFVSGLGYWLEDEVTSGRVKDYYKFEEKLVRFVTPWLMTLQVKP